MPFIETNGTKLYYEEHGQGEETIVFSHGLLMSTDMFSSQIETLSKQYRCIAFDHRGQGRSEITEDGYDIDNLTVDATGLIEQLNAAPCHFVGLSMGGFVGMRLAIRRPELLKSLVLMETSADPEPNARSYRIMAFVGRWLGFGIVAPRVMKIMFGKTFLEDPGRDDEKKYWRNRVVDNDRLGTTRAAQGVIDREGVYEQLDRIRTPTLVLVGDEDVATVPEKSRRIQEQIEGSKLVMIPGAGHSSSIEQPAAVTHEIQTFLSNTR